MKLIGKLIKNRRLLVVVGIIILILLILVAGKSFGLSSNQRLIGVVIVLFLWVLMLMLERNKANRGAELLEQSIKAQAEQQIMGLRPAKREEIEQLQQQLIASIDALKKSKLGKGRSGKSALYALPWYVFIGPPASGKTTAIINSGLDFPYGSERIRGVGGTRNCDWFFSSQAILLDTAGRYTTEEEDKEEWLAFLEILKKYRKRQPINGVLIGVSIADLANANWDEIERHATNIRRRIDELIERLGVRFPVYLVFTKCDLLQGHVEFFEELNRVEREQIWGSTLTRDQQNDPNPAAVFDLEFQELYRSLINLRFTRLSSPTKREIRHKIFNYPLGFESMREKLSQFVGRLFQPNPYKESPLFRGFYFTSGTQEGVPIDRVLQAIAKNFDLPPEMIAPFDPAMETKSYFIKDLFTDVIVPDQHLVTETSRAATQKRLLRFGMVAAAVVALAAFVLGVSSGFVRSKRDLNKVNESAKFIQLVDWKEGGNVLNYFRRLERVRDQIDQIENRTSTLLQFGMHQGKTVLDPARRLYYKKSQEFIQQYIYSELERRLRNVAALNEEQAYNYLKAYLLMGDEKKRLNEETKLKKDLGQEFNSILNESFYKSITGSNVDSLRILVDRQINFYIDLLAKKDVIFKFENDKGLIQRVRRSIYINPSITSVYLSLKNEARSALKPYTISQALNSSQSNVILCDFEVPGFFTRHGWESFVQKNIEDRSRNPLKEDWVFGDRKVALPANMRDSEQMKEELKQLYYDDYVRNWRTFLQSIKYESFVDIADAARRLKLLGDIMDSPIKTLINSVSEQTQFESGFTSTAKEKTGSAGEKIFGPGHAVDRNFVSLHALTNDEARNAILSHYATLSSILEGMVGDPGLKAKDTAASILQSGSGQLPDVLRPIQNALPTFDLTARKAIFEQPIYQAWATILGETQKYLNSQWQQRIAEHFQMTLTNLYPFNRNGKDAPLADFDNFFQPEGGIFWTFFKEELTPFFQENSWRIKPWADQGIQFSGEFIGALKKADDIRKNFYQGGSFEVKFSLTHERPDKQTFQGEPIVVDQIRLNIDGKEDFYSMGLPYRMDYRWPGNQGSPGAMLDVSIHRRNNPDPKKFDGVWGWIKLLHEATITKQTTARYQLKWLFKYQNQYQVWVKYELDAEGGYYNPFGNIKTIFDFRCPRTLN